ncbi:hypothetical protein QJS04_geneDACA019398 [Acorus gramineus]|uniref:Uncharacterized protein n=1 Tax=Acorus gramineus TaxID=55184 RepID=A0AAV9AKK5_ACOGR|nr:hypothetical protein QJS04_geneDACA019398 [Acorus gramineus]
MIMSSFYGEQSSLGNNNSSGRSGSSRNRKKSHSDKPRQPQRGLGVAQLEQIRLQNQMEHENVRVELGISSSPPSSSSSSSFSSPFYGFHPNNMMNFGDIQRQGIRYGSESHSSYSARWNQNTTTLEPRHIENHHHIHLGASPVPLRQLIEDSAYKKRRQDSFDDSKGSSDKNSDVQELDLELKLSL